MAITLDATVTDHIARIRADLSVDPASGGVPPGATITNALATAGVIADTAIRVSDVSAWPRKGEVTILDGTDTEQFRYSHKTDDNGRRASQGPDARGNLPTGWLIGAPASGSLAAGVLAANHALATPVYDSFTGDTQPQVRGAVAMDDGLVGAHEISALLKQFRLALNGNLFDTSAVGAGAGATVVCAANTFGGVDSELGKAIAITSGDRIGETDTVASNTTDTLTVTVGFTGNVEAGVSFTIDHLTTAAGSTTTVVSAAATFASVDSEIGNLVTLNSGLASGEESYVVSNTATTLTVSPAFSAASGNGTNYSITPAFFDTQIETIEAMLPTGGADPDSTYGYIDGAKDTAATPGYPADLFIQALHFITTQLGGTLPTIQDGADLLERDILKSTYLTAPTGAGDTIIYVTDATRLGGPGTAITVGSTAATVSINYAKRGASGPKAVKLTAAIGAIEASGATVWNTNQTVETGLIKKRIEPHYKGVVAYQYLEAAQTAIEAHTVPA